MRIWFFVLLFAGISLYAQSEKLIVAVGTFEARGVPESDVGILTDRLRNELTNMGTFRVMERALMDEILKEQAFQQSGACDTRECQVQIGQMLGVDRMIVGSIGLLGGSVYTVSARILDVGTGEVLHTVNEDYQGNIAGVLSRVLPKVATGLSGRPVARPALPPVQGTLQVHSEPAGAVVYLNGDSAGVTPLLLQRKAGEYGLRVEKEDHFVHQQNVTLRAGKIVRVRAPLAKGARLTLKVTPPNAQVQLDGDAVNWRKIPLQKPGERTLRVNKWRYRPWEQQVDLTLNRSLEVHLEKIPWSGKEKAAFWFWGAGGAGLLAGALLNASGKSAHSDYEKALTRSDALDTHDRTQSLERGRNVAYGLAVTAIVTGVVLWLLD